MSRGSQIAERSDLRDRVGVFADRQQAGSLLADMLRGQAPPNALVLAVPAGGVPVAVAVASGLDLPLDVAVASKITPPWNTELGYGAVAFDDSVLINQPLVRQLGLTDAQVQAGTDLARRKVHRRLELLRLGRGPLHLAGRAVLLVDDGLATGYTLLAAHGAIRAAGAGGVIPAVPTAHANSLQAVVGQFSAVYCPNVRSGGAFAVAGAYRNWDDVTEARARQLLEEFWRERKDSSA